MEKITAAELRARKRSENDLFFTDPTTGGCTRYNVFNRDAPKSSRLLILVHGATVASKIILPLARKIADATNCVVVTYDQYARGLSDRLVQGIDYSVRWQKTKIHKLLHSHNRKVYTREVQIYCKCAITIRSLTTG